jgi:transposase InsO family protein
MPKYYYNQLIRKRLAWILMYEKTGNASQVCRYYGISRKTFYKWLNRYRKSKKNPTSLLDRSTRPKKSPNETKQKVQKLIKDLRKQTKFGPDRLSLFLQIDNRKSVHRSTIYAILKRKGLIKKPARKRKKTYKLYTMPYPGHIQLDIKMIGGYRPNRFVQYTAIDDCTRIKFTRLYQERSTYNSIKFLTCIIKRFPFKIKSIRTDNDTVFTNAYTGEPRTHPLKVPRAHPFTLACKNENIKHILNRPSCPQQNGKVERSHRTDSEEFYRLQKILDYVLLIKGKKKYDEFFNNHRPHMGIRGLTPLQKLQTFKEFKTVTYVYS